MGIRNTLTLALALPSLGLAGCGSGSVAVTQSPGPTPAQSSYAPAVSSSASLPATPVPTATPTRSPAATTVPDPQLTCSAAPAGPSPHLLLARTLNGLQGTLQTGSLIEDIDEPTDPRKICSLSGFASPTFISGSEIGYAFNHGENDPLASTVVIARASLIDQTPRTVVTLRGAVISLAWSPDRSTLAYLLDVDLPPAYDQTKQLWIKRGDAAAVALTPLLPVFGRGGYIDDQTYVRFSGDGKYLAMIDTTAGGPANTVRDQAYFQVRSVADGSLVWAPLEGLASLGKGPGAATMGVWSAADDTLYYDDSAGVEAWNPQSGSRTLVAGLHWYNPSASPDGRLVAYTVLDSQKRPHVEVRDLQSGSVRVFPALRSAALFLSATLLLQDENAPCTEGMPCAFFADGKVFAVDLTSGTETLMPFTLAIERWPH